MDPTTANYFRRDYELAQQTVQHGVSVPRSKSGNSHWEEWSKFTTELGLNTLLTTCEDQIPILQVFAQRVRNGVHSRSHKQIRARSVEDYLRSIGQTFSCVGASDPRYSINGKMDYRLQQMIKS